VGGYLEGRENAGGRRVLDQKNVLRGVIVAMAFTAAACSRGDSAQEMTAFDRGERVYKNVCIACHNADPMLQGSLGPPIAGSSRELLEHRVLHGTYPEGYERQRESAVMPQFPHLAGSIDDLAAYLAGDGAEG
jgi:mono/diheme cytochrome c family protein